MVRTAYQGNEGGFTLIELLVTVAVVAVLLAAAVPSFTEFFDKSRVRGAADDIVSMISTSRGDAVKVNRNVTVTVGGTTAAWCVGANQAATPAVTQPIVASVACDCTAAAACMVDGQERVVSSARYSGSTVSAVGGTFVIDGRLGTLVGLAGPTFDVNSPSGKYALRVTVSPMGHTRACTPAAKPVIPGYAQC